jgi:hypothetical protein
MIEHDTEQKNKAFTCTICDHTWDRKYNYDQHLKTTKHIKKLKIYEQLLKSNEQIRKTEQTPQENDEGTVKNIINKFCCDYCQFSTPNKKEANEHRTSKQHIMNENKEEDFLEIIKRYTCTKCDKTYDKYKNCWEHVRKCEGNVVMKIHPVTQLVVTNEDNIKKDIVESIVEKMMVNNNQMIENNNKQMMEQIVTVVKTILQEIKPSVTQNNTNYTNNNSNNNNNNHYTINMFLNEKCKDAINITDWAKQLHIDYDHLYYTGENGFQKGLTNMLVENLKLCDVYNRPIHFTDVKRDSMYIREADEWTKHENSEKLTEVLEISARQACIRLTEWMKEHEDVPDYHNLDSELGKQYLALMMSVIRPQVERTKAFPKVIKELAKTAQLRKEDQV